jgi:nucleoid DNA-binding protein
MFSMPGDFWDQPELQEIMKKANHEYEAKLPFVMPYQKSIDPKTKEEFNLFDRIIVLLCYEFGKEFTTNGYIDLDKCWTEAKLPMIVKCRSSVVKVKDEEKTLYQLYPNPYCGRKAYMCQIGWEPVLNEKKEAIKNEDGSIQTSLARIKVQAKNEGRFTGILRICSFGLFESKKAVVRQDINPETGEIIESVDTPRDKKGFDYVLTYGFMGQAMKELIEKIGAEIRSKDPLITAINGFAITPALKPPSTEPNGFKFYSCELDHWVLMKK